MSISPKSNVVIFPDEVQRTLIARLANAPTFATYLESVERCLIHNLDVSPLIQWWSNNVLRITSEHAELDFRFFLDRIRLGMHSWEEEKAERIAKHEAYLERHHRVREGKTPELRHANQLAEALEAEVEAARVRIEFGVSHPKYRNAFWVFAWFRVVERALGSHESLEVIADHFSRFFYLEPVAPETGRKSPEEPASLADYKLSLLERPPWVVFGSEVHAHLLTLADWVGGCQHPESRLVFEFLLSSPESRKVISQTELMTALRRCTHGLFAYLMTEELLDVENPAVLISLLELPLAVGPDPKGLPHLTPEFCFIGTLFRYQSGLEYSYTKTQREALTTLWKQFFNRYRELRIKYNFGQTFEDGGIPFQFALATVWGSEECYECEELDCVERSFSCMDVDLLCALDYFNRSYFPYLGMMFDDLLDEDTDGEMNPDYVANQARILTKIILPLTHQLVKEEWYKLSCNLFAFYLVLVALQTKGNLDSYQGIGSTVKMLRGLPGYQHVEKAIELICQLASESGHSLTYARFSQFRQTPDEAILSLITEAEGETVEFKSTLRTNLSTGTADKRMEDSVLKTIAGFMNKRGGNLLVGVKDDGTVAGIEADGFANTDKWALHFKNLVNATIPGGMDHLTCTFSIVDGKTIACIGCQPADQPVYLLNRENKQEYFYVRRGAGTDCLGIREALDYIQRRSRVLT